MGIVRRYACADLDGGGSRETPEAQRPAKRPRAARDPLRGCAVKPRHRRGLMIVGLLAALGIATALVLSAFQQNLVFFFTPTQIAENEAPLGRTFRVGGMVEPGSVKRQSDGVTVQFVVTDTAKGIP